MGVSCNVVEPEGGVGVAVVKLLGAEVVDMDEGQKQFLISG